MMVQSERKRLDQAKVSEELCWGIVDNGEWDIFVRAYKEGEGRIVAEVFVNLACLDIPDDPYDSMGGAGCIVEVPKDASPEAYQTAVEKSLNVKGLIKTAINEATDYLVSEAKRLSGGLLH